MTDILDLIDGAIADATSRDAMRWMPGREQPSFESNGTLLLGSMNGFHASWDDAELLCRLWLMSFGRLSCDADAGWHWVMSTPTINQILTTAGLPAGLVDTESDQLRLFGLPIRRDEHATIPTLELNWPDTPTR